MKQHIQIMCIALCLSSFHSVTAMKLVLDWIYNHAIIAPGKISDPGSQAFHELKCIMDADNAIIYEDGDPNAPTNNVALLVTGTALAGVGTAALYPLYNLLSRTASEGPTAARTQAALITAGACASSLYGAKTCIQQGLHPTPIYKSHVQELINSLSSDQKKQALRDKTRRRQVYLRKKVSTIPGIHVGNIAKGSALIGVGTMFGTASYNIASAMIEEGTSGERVGALLLATIISSASLYWGQNLLVERGINHRAHLDCLEKKIKTIETLLS